MERKVLKADVVLVAIGRRPNTNKLGLENVGIKTNARGFIENNHLRTSVDNIFVIGDVTTGPMLAHKAEDEEHCRGRNYYKPSWSCELRCNS